MKKAKISGKLSLKKQTISNLTSSSIMGGATNPSVTIGCPYTDTAACPGTTSGCTSGTSVVISCCDYPC
nr:class I lanthipeptide [Allomuricauda sp.]